VTNDIRIRRAGRILTLAVMVGSLLTLASTAGASNATLRVSVNSWSRDGRLRIVACAVGRRT